MSALRTALGAAAALVATEAAASDLTVHEISLALAQATPDAPADFSDKDLGGLDLSDLDFRGANLAGANLTAADLTDANLSRSNLARAQLDRAIVIRTNFAGADLSRTSLVWLVAFSGLEVRPDERRSDVRPGRRRRSRGSDTEERGWIGASDRAGERAEP